MGQEPKKLSLLVERGTIVKINGLTKQLNTNLTINVPESFLDDQDILELDRSEVGL
jgi:hypothetical protein